MFDKLKREKQDRHYRNSLRMIPHLLRRQDKLPLLLKTYPSATKGDALKAATLI